MPPARKTKSTSRVSKTKSNSSTPRISVVIAGHNRPDSLRETLRALREQTLSPKQYEVILVGFTQMSLQSVADENAKLAKHGFTYVEIPTRWPDAKRNEGIRRARGEFVAFTDDDVLPSTEWLESILAAFEKNPNALGIEGQTEGDNTPLLSHATKNLKGGEYPTCNLAFRTDILRKVGGFDEAYHFFREDTDIAYKVLQLGPIVFDANVKVFHPTRKTTANSVLRELGMTRGEIRLYKKFPQRYAKAYRTFLGLPGRGGWLQAIIAYMASIAFVFFLLTIPGLVMKNGAMGAGAPLLAMLGVFLLYWGFRSLVSFKGRKASLEEKFHVGIYLLARDLAYPFFFLYFWFTERPTRAETP